VGKGQGRNPFNVGDLKETISIDIVLTKVTKWEFSHNVHQAETVEEIGRSIPRIYASLDNKQVEFQSHMIEVEGGRRKNFPSASGMHYGPKNQIASESIHRACKGPMELVRS
jgi:hypothetical protein